MKDKTERQNYMRSKKWKEIRKAKLEAYGGICECEGGCYRKATQIHHIHYDTFGDESLEDLQALCAKCHMKKSRVPGFYGTVPRNCCQHSLSEQEPPKKLLPYHVYHEANFHYHNDSEKYERIASQLETEPVIAALLDNLGIMFGCGDISVEEKITQAIDRFVYVVEASEVDLDGYTELAYKIKPEFEKYFPRACCD